MINFLLAGLLSLFIFPAISEGTFFHILPKSCSGRTLKPTLSCLNLESNLKLSLDVGSGGSYAGGQSWLDESGNANHFFLGATNSGESTDPTFNGTAGRASGSEFWSLDGGDYFRFSAANPTWVENIHKDGAKFTYIAVLQFNGVPSAGVSRGVLGTLGNDGTKVGHQFQVTDLGAIRFQNWNNSTQCLSALTADGVVSQSAWHFLAVSIDENAGASGGFFYLDGAQVGAAFDPSYTTPSAAASAYTMELGGVGNGQRLLTNTDRIAIAAAWEGVALNTTQLNQIFQALRGRFGI